jgi:hypothetical protein
MMQEDWVEEELEDIPLSNQPVDPNAERRPNSQEHQFVESIVKILPFTLLSKRPILRYHQVAFILPMNLDFSIETTENAALDLFSKAIVQLRDERLNENEYIDGARKISPEELTRYAERDEWVHFEPKLSFPEPRMIA